MASEVKSEGFGQTEYPNMICRLLFFTLFSYCNLSIFHFHVIHMERNDYTMVLTKVEPCL